MRPLSILTLAAITIGFLVPAAFVVAQAAGWWSMPDMTALEGRMGLHPGAGNWILTASAITGTIMCWGGMWLDGLPSRRLVPPAGTPRDRVLRFGIGLLAVGLCLPAIVFTAALFIGN